MSKERVKYRVGEKKRRIAAETAALRCNTTSKKISINMAAVPT
jgi:hypothetical protein